MNNDLIKCLENKNIKIHIKKSLKKTFQSIFFLVNLIFFNI